MKKTVLLVFWMLQFMFFCRLSIAQQLVGESDPFIFDTRQPVVPISDYAPFIFLILAASFILVRYYYQKRKAAF